MSISKEKIPLYIISALIFLSLLDQSIPGARYSKYLIIPICLIIAPLKKLKFKAPTLIIPFYIYLAIGLTYFIASKLSGISSSIDDLMFMLTYTLPFALIQTKTKITPFFSVAVIFFIAGSIAKTGTNINFNILNSESTFEHHEFGFIFAIFFIYFTTNKQYRLALFAAALTLLTLKRIALAGAALSIAVFYTKEIWHHRKILFATIAATANILIIGAIKYSATESFNDLTTQILGISSNQLMMGRAVLYSYILDNTTINWLYGQGPGSVYEYASAAFDSAARVLLHSDILKLAIEFGLLFCFIFFFVLYISARFNLEYLIYLNIIMITDNPLIYGGVMYFLFLIASNSPKHLETNHKIIPNPANQKNYQRHTLYRKKYQTLKYSP